MDPTSSEERRKGLPPPFVRVQITQIDWKTPRLSDLPPEVTPRQIEDHAHEAEGDRWAGVPWVIRRTPVYGPTVELRNVPELRVFGATDAGQRCLLHIHGALPYIYVNYPGEANPDAANAYMLELARSINAALPNDFPSAQGEGRKKRQPGQYVGFTLLVKGTDFFGYRVGHDYFIKLYLLQPRFTRRVVDLLKRGKCMGTKFTVYEGHIPYILQFLADHNLQGCGWIELERCKFRELPEDVDEVEAAPSPDATPPEWHRLLSTANVPSTMRYPAGKSPPRIGTSVLELDCHVADIINRRLNREHSVHHDFSELVHPTPDDRRYVFSVAELWLDQTKRNEAEGKPPPKEVDQTGGIERMYGVDRPPPFTAVKAKYADHLAERITRDRARKAVPPTLDSFVPPKPFADHVRTAYDSVVALFPSTLEEDERTSNPFGVMALRGIGYGATMRAAAGSTRAGSVAPSVAGEPDEEEDFGDEFGADDGMDDLDAPVPRAVRPTQVPVERYEDDPATDDDDPMDIDADERDREVSLAPSDRNTARSVSPAPIPGPGLLTPQKPVAGPSRSPSPLRAPPTPIVAASVIAKKVALTTPELQRAGLADLDAIANSSIRLSSPAVVKGAPAPQSGGRKGQGYSPPKRHPATVAAADNHFAASVALRPSLKRSGPDEEPQGLAKLGATRGLVKPGVQQTRPTELQDVGFRAKPVGPLKQHFAVVNAVAPVELSEDEEVVMAPAPAQQFVRRSASSSSTATMADVDDPDEPMPSPTLIDKGSAVLDDDGAELSATDVEDNAPQRPVKRARIGETTVIDSGDSAGPAPSPKWALGAIEDEPPSLSFAAASSTETDIAPSTVVPPPAASSRLFATSSTVLAAEPTGRQLQYAFAPPTRDDVLSSLAMRKIYQPAFYSHAKDAPTKRFEYAGRTFMIPGQGVRWLFDFHDRDVPAPELRSRMPRVPPDQGVPKVPRGIKTWTFAPEPPGRREMMRWLEREGGKKVDKTAAAPALQTQWIDPTQISGPTQQPFKFTQFKQADAPARKSQHLAVFSLEVHVNTRGTLKPDPELDAIHAIFYSLQREVDEPCLSGFIALTNENGDPCARVPKLGFDNGLYETKFVDEESELYREFIDTVLRFDPDVLTGFEVQLSSWGYLIERYIHVMEDNLLHYIGRVTEQQNSGHRGKGDRWGYQKTSTISVTGRHVLPVWRIFKGEVALTSYTLPSLVWHVLRRRTPSFSHTTLTRWLRSGDPRRMARVYQYWLDRTVFDIQLLEEGEIMSRNAEFARVFGIDLFSVFSRGSQFKVEAVMIRIAKPESYMLPSPSREEVGKLCAAECTPLIQEPHSAFYTDPVVVLDFQSLYPSVMIAYNLCYSTCLGRVDQFQKRWVLGHTEHAPPPGLLALLEDHLFISPNGLLFVKPTLRRGLLGRMLRELLDTRVMVKSSMKGVNDKALLKMLNARQLGLKFLANVTYGYTSATFSGRMPCVEMADAIVQTGRETLERAIKLIHSRSWPGFEHVKPQVVYGDTDSLFVKMPGVTREQAFVLGNLMADEVTAVNPAPVKLKFEKVYLPCLLMAKKRYVGFKYESPNDLEPIFDAKGIETIRRDGFPAMQKMVETSIKLLFRTQDLSLIKSFCIEQWEKMLRNEVSPQDFIFAFEVTLGMYSENATNHPPGAVLSSKRLEFDKRDEPQYGERVPWVVPVRNKRKINEVATGPLDFLGHRANRLDADFYIERTLKALERIFLLVGAQPRTWYDKARRTQRYGQRGFTPEPEGDEGGGGGDDVKPGAAKLKAKGDGTLLHALRSKMCRVCQQRNTDRPTQICDECARHPDASAHHLLVRQHAAERRQMDLLRLCASCAHIPANEARECIAVECPVLYDRFRAQRDLEDAATFTPILDALAR